MNIYIKEKLFFSIFTAITLLGCNSAEDQSSKTPSDSEEPVIHETMNPKILDFVNSFNFQKLQPIVEILHIPEKSITVFMVTYGEPQDCIAGCFYSSAEGLLNGDKIGWIAYNDFGLLPENHEYFYDFGLGDEYLFTDEFYSALCSSHGWVDHGSFMRLLAKDRDTPYEILLRYAETLATERGHGALAIALLDNPVVQSDINILSIIASLPLEYSEYHDSIIEAGEFLSNL